MSLKIIHLIFIICSMFMFIFTGVWSYCHENLLFLGLSLFCLVLLVMYLKKMFFLFFFSAFLSLLPIPSLSACAVCFGKTDDLTVKALSWGVLTMLGFVIFLWIAFAIFFIYLHQKAKKSAGVSYEH